MLKTTILLVFAAFTVIAFSGRPVQPVVGKAESKEENPAIVRLGERLFRDERFSTPNGDLPASCSNCHLLDEDPQGLRAYADFFNRSWFSSRSQDHRRLELRNSPTIFDTAEMPRLHYDGEFTSLEGLVKGTFSGRPMGWLPGEETQAFERARAVVLNDTGEGVPGGVAYRVQFKTAFGVELDRLGRDEIVDLVAQSVAAFVRTLKTRKDSPYDRFIESNGLERKPGTAESGKAFARRLLSKIESLESKRSLKMTKDFGRAELEGLKLFFTTDGHASAGNCVTCHTPPLFTDFSFHNLGISQLEYDRFHGEGKFAALAIPNAAEARRPSTQFREMPSKDKPGWVDLGFWNFVDLKNSPLRQAVESEDLFLQRMIATFKTPTLRNLKYTQPYFHDGSIHTLDELMSEMIRLSEMSRRGVIRESDQELAAIRLAASDIAPLVAFMNSLNENLKR